MAKKKKASKRHSKAAMIKQLQQLNPGFDVVDASQSKPAASSWSGDAGKGSKTRRSYVGNIIATPDLMSLKQKYGLISGADSVPNGTTKAKSYKIPKTTKGTNQVFELRPKKGTAADKAVQSKTVLVSKFTNRPVSAQG